MIHKKKKKHNTNTVRKIESKVLTRVFVFGESLREKSTFWHPVVFKGSGKSHAE